MLVRDLRAAPPEPPDSSDVRWTMLEDGDLARVRTIDPGLSEAMVDRWHAEGRECQLGWVGDALAHVRWDATASPYLPFLGRTLRLLDGDCHSAHAFTLPTFRRRGLHMTGHLRALHRAHQRGYTRSISLAAWWNAPALDVAEHAARRTRVGTIGFWNLAMARHDHASGAVRLAGSTELYVER